ncbi:RBR-type E3 ubiquitin transferase [Mycena chlorophos]|uniref:RBR-type E3 ubiquitin transferase n=1 Tax=Mycena chlorophos TaxID=658473 RepID=A0A8H6WPC9_MYCCL|nr:RBR-type E3 ubiquitin transferase [Mycena chlorophos]
MSSDEYSDDDVDNVFDEDDDIMLDGDSDGDDGMDMDDDFKVVSKPSRKAYEIEYDSFSQSAVEKLMAADVEYITGILGVDASTAALLLRHMSWNKERLVEKYMDNANKMLVSAGVNLPDPETVRTSKRPLARRTTRRSPSPPKSSASFTCSICFDESPDLKPLSLECGHKACSGCWEAYIESKITTEAEHVCRCMAEGCGLVAPDAFIRTAVSDDIYERFEELLVRHYVGCTSTLKFCPYPSCTNTVSCPSAASKSSLTTVVPIVSCGARGLPTDQSLSQSQELSKGISAKEHKFCFGCTIDSDHRPVVCGVALLWLKKCRDDSETANWIKSNTKECPKCVSTIEKNGGCNHMTCKKCKNEFCWVCMGPWSEHGTAYYSCNRYDEKGGVDARDAQSRSRASLERYLHYYNRWANHEQSAKLALDLFSKTEKKMDEMQVTSSLTWIEVQFMKTALEVLDKCRITLKWTYAMAYYLAKGNEKELFEDNQRDLERAVEELSELIESPLDPETIPALRQKVTDKMVYVQKRNEIVLDDTARGFLDGRWAWNVSVDGFEKPAVEAADGI